MVLIIKIFLKEECMKNTFILLFTVMLLVGSLVWAGGEQEAEAKEVSIDPPKGCLQHQGD